MSPIIIKLLCKQTHKTERVQQRNEPTNEAPGINRYPNAKPIDFFIEHKQVLSGKVDSVIARLSAPHVGHIAAKAGGKNGSPWHCTVCSCPDNFV